MKTICFFLFLLLGINSFGQINYEKGYFIDNNNERKECLIKNTDWRCNPSRFDVKWAEGDKPMEMNMSSVKEFGIYNYSKYIRALVKIDRSPEDISSLSVQRSPEWSEDSLFLKVLIEGKGSLYYFEGKGISRFFYKIADSSVQQLVYKKYKVNGNMLAENIMYQQQLLSDVACNNPSLGSVENIKYTLRDIKKYFENYNTCSNVEFINYTNISKGKEKRKLFNLRITPGLNYSSLSLSNSTLSLNNVDFDSEIGFRIGIETEFILPYNRNKWRIVIEPTYQYFNSEKKLSTQYVNVHYNSIQFPIGLRYCLFVNKETAMFLNGFLIPNYNITFKSEIYFEKSGKLDIKSRDSFAFGGGITLKRISAEIRYYTNQNITSNYVYWAADYKRLSLIVGYRFL